MLVEFLERRPSVGILASFTGTSAALVTWLQAATPILSFLGAAFGFGAGFYTWRIQRHKWEREQRHHHTNIAVKNPPSPL
jgi:hypothetical protein